MAESRRILIVRTDRMGDVVLSTPVIRALRRAYPSAYLGMMVQPAHRDLVEGHPDLDVVILYDKEGAQKGWLDNLRFARQLRSYRFDTAIILHSTNRVILVAWLAGIRCRIGYARRLPALLTDRIPYIKGQGEEHELEYNLKLLGIVGIGDIIPISKEQRAGNRYCVPGMLAPFVPIRAEADRRVASFLLENGIRESAEPLVVIHPGASCPSKRWATRRFALVADRLVDQHGARILVLTGPEEKGQGAEVLRQMQRPAIAALGLFAVGELAPLFRRARCLVSNDSGPVHIAGAVGTPVVSIFGRWGGGLSPRRWGPVGPNGLALHHDIGCRPCLAHRCTIGFTCLEAVTVEEVLAAVEYVAGLKGTESGK